MSSTYGQNLKLSIFGQSHGAAIGMTLDGIPSGLPFDPVQLQRFLDRRTPGRNRLSSPRREPDKPRFLSGIVDGFTCGAPIAAIIENTDPNPRDYDTDLPRPGHADFTAQMKYSGFQDGSGGGHFSGRLTAPMCIAGGLCLQWLEKMGIRIGAHIIQIGHEKARRFDPMCPELDMVGQIFPTLTAQAAENFQRTIESARAQQDSVGGRVECAVVGAPAGLGAPMFAGVENRIAQLIYGIPAVKNLGFGLSEDFAAVLGSESNDPFAIQNGKITTATNHCGGILGGITTGMPLLFDVTFKPTPSIGKPQQTVSFSRMEECTLSISGRHDPCIVPRAVPVVEAAAAIAVFDMILDDPTIMRK